MRTKSSCCMNEVLFLLTNVNGVLYYIYIGDVRFPVRKITKAWQ
jgi:hypothetical protein